MNKYSGRYWDDWCKNDSITPDVEEQLPMCQRCSKRQYEIGVHGVLDGEVVSSYYCEECWNEIKTGRKVTKEEENAPD